MEGRRQGQRIDRMFEPLRRLACSIHGTQARRAHIHPTKKGFPCGKTGLAAVAAGNASRKATLFKIRFGMMRRALDWRWATGTDTDDFRERQADENEWTA